MNWWHLLAGVGLSGVIAIGLGLVVSIPAAKRRNDAAHAEQVAEMIRQARRRENVAALDGELTEAFRPLVGAHSTAQPGRQVHEFVAARRQREAPRHRRPRGRNAA